VLQHVRVCDRVHLFGVALITAAARGHRVMNRYSFVIVMAVALALQLPGCGGSTNSDPFALCGDGRIDPGEECDDGNLLDNDHCLSTCVRARCGDGFIDIAAEQCDGRNFDSCGSAHAGTCTCASFGLASGALACSSACQFDTSRCGPVFTPTPTPTQTPVVTATTTATPTPGPVCGNGLLEGDETCATCAADCAVRTCAATSPVRAEIVTMTIPSSQTVGRVMLRLSYRSAIVSLPGSGSASTVTSRIKNRPSNAFFTINDLDYALEVTVQRAAIASGQLFTVEFDSCGGAPAPTTADFDCLIEDCSGVPGCTCSIAIP